jgi:hypothetical protein
MAKYLITEKAGTFVAGHRNTGVGTVLELPPLAAEYELTLGTLRPATGSTEIAGAMAPASEPVAVEAEPEPEATEEPVAAKKKPKK